MSAGDISVKAGRTGLDAAPGMPLARAPLMMDRLVTTLNGDS